MSMAESMEKRSFYHLKWNNHGSNLCTMFYYLFQTESLTDVTLFCKGQLPVKCHKAVLAANSSYFQNVFKGNECRHSMFILGDIQLSEMLAVLKYMYMGEVCIDQDQFPGFLKAAEILQLKGLVEENGLGSSDTPQLYCQPPNQIPSTPTMAESQSPAYFLESQNQMNGENNYKVNADCNDTTLDYSQDHFMKELSYEKDQKGPQNGQYQGGVTDKPKRKPVQTRYKKYSKENIMSAVAAVQGGMSALQAARTFGVPSRTVYDKVKKLGNVTTSVNHRQCIMKDIFQNSLCQNQNGKAVDISMHKSEKQTVQGNEMEQTQDRRRLSDSTVGVCFGV